MFYVSNDNTLRFRELSDGFWTSPDDLGEPNYIPDPSEYTVAEDSRHLSVGVYATPNVTSVLMLYQSSVSGVTLLKGSYGFNETGVWRWNNFSSSLFHESQRVEYNLSVPFTLISRNSTEFVEMLIATEKNGKYPGFFMSAYFDGSEIG